MSFVAARSTKRPTARSGAAFMAGLFLGIGAGPGIGLSTARRFATEGFWVVLAARKWERLEALEDDLRRGPNAGVEIASVDCSDSLQVGELVGRYAPDLDVANEQFTVAKAEAAITEGAADAVAFGVKFIANPYLPARIKTAAPLNEPDPDTFYGGGAKGYVDYPVLQRSPAVSIIENHSE